MVALSAGEGLCVSRGAIVELTQAQPAARLGASRQPVNAALAEFERRGLIACEGRRVRVCDPGGLRVLLNG